MGSEVKFNIFLRLLTDEHFMMNFEKHFRQNLNFFSYFINVLKTFPVKPSFLSYFINV